MDQRIMGWVVCLGVYLIATTAVIWVVGATVGAPEAIVTTLFLTGSALAIGRSTFPNGRG